MGKVTKDKEVGAVKIKEFENAEEIARYVYEELTKMELIKLMSNNKIFNNDIGKNVIDILLEKNDRIIKTSNGKYQFIIED